MVRSTVTGSARRRGQGGWTLIELMVVTAMIALLAGMAMANYQRAVRISQEAVLKENLFRMRDAIDQYYADKNRYPPSLESLVSDGYLRRIPEDPFTRSADTWQAIQSEPDTSNPNAEPGVFDVKSGSDQTSVAGTPYASGEPPPARPTAPAGRRLGGCATPSVRRRIPTTLHALGRHLAGRAVSPTRRAPMPNPASATSERCRPALGRRHALFGVVMPARRPYGTGRR